MRQKLAKWVEATGGVAELVRDAHVYIGGIMAAAGLAWWHGHAGVGVLVMGLVLIYIGLRGA